MDLVVGGHADGEAQVLLAGLLEQFLRLVDIDRVGIVEFLVEVFLQAGGYRGSGLCASAVADSVDDLLGIHGIGNGLADPDILEGTEVIVEGQELDGVGVADILDIVAAFQLLPAAARGVESIDRARQIVGRELCGVFKVFESDRVQMGGLSPVVLELCQQGVVLLDEFAHHEGAGADRVCRQVLGVRGDDRAGDDSGEARVGHIQMNDDGLFIRGGILGIGLLDLGLLALAAVLLLYGLVGHIIGLAGRHEAVDLVVSVDGGVDGLLDGIDDIGHGQVVSVVELDSVAEDEGIGLQVFAGLPGLGDGGLEAAVGLRSHQTLVNIEENAARIRCLHCEGVKSGRLCGDTLDKITALHHLTGRSRRGCIGCIRAACGRGSALTRALTAACDQ